MNSLRSGLGFARAATCANPESLGAMAGSTTHRWLRLGHSPDVKSPCGCPRQSLSSERGVVGSGAACRRRRLRPDSHVHRRRRRRRQPKWWRPSSPGGGGHVAPRRGSHKVCTMLRHPRVLSSALSAESSTPRRDRYRAAASGAVPFQGCRPQRRESTANSRIRFTGTNAY